MSTQERMKILEMIAEGRISAEEASRLLDAASTPGAEPASQGAVTPEKVAAPEWSKTPSGTPRRLRVKVMEDNGTRVNVNLPLSLMEVGLKIGGRFVPELRGMDSEMQMLMDAIQNDVVGKIVEVDDEDSHVEIYIE